MAMSLMSRAIFAALLSSLTPDQHQNVPGTSFPGSPGTTKYIYAKTADGTLRGNETYSKSNVKIQTFLGIPFAKPPTGDLRFQAPQPPTSWSGIRDATKFGSICLQQNLYASKTWIEGYSSTVDEDCLYLNVYTPCKDRKDLAVMVWIHGGGYYVGAGSQYDASEIAARDVVVVTINYRLDVFGFLSTEDDAAPGNYGMLDQVMALKWVQKNIRAFGGDPDTVTIFGQSAGSGSVSLLTLSPLASGLFKRGIMESGSALSPWAMSHDAARITQANIAKLIGGRVGCPQTDSKPLIQCLRTVDSELLFNVSDAFRRLSTIQIIFAPRVENTYGFLPKHPYTLLKSGNYNKVDLIIGFNKIEFAYQAKNNSEKTDVSNVTIDVFRKIVMDDISSDLVLADQQTVYNKIKNLYLPTASDPVVIRSALQSFRSDYYFNLPTLIEIDLRSKIKTSPATKSYLYNFTYTPSNYALPDWSSPTHGAEVPFVFGVDIEGLKIFGYSGDPSIKDRQVAEQVQSGWINFAKYGVPIMTSPAGSGKWTPFTQTSQSYLDISWPSKMKTYSRQREIDLFKELLFQMDNYS